MNRMHSEETIKIAKFLTVFAPIIQDLIRHHLARNGYAYKASGRGFDLAYEIVNNDRKVIFFFRNLYLEIVTVDRDSPCLEFDEKLSDRRYFVSKAISIARSKLEVLDRLLKSDEPDQAIEDIFMDFKGSRILIQKLDATESGN